MVDILTAAQREANRLRVTSNGREYGMAKLYKDGFVDGAEWGADRVTPTWEQISETLAGAYDEWCVLLEEFLAGGGVDPGSEYEDKADAVLKLMAGLAEGEKLKTNQFSGVSAL